MISRVFGFVVSCAILTAPITVRAADRIVPRPPNGTFTYEMHLNGKPVGTTRIVFGSAADGALTIDEQATITGIAAVSQTLLGPALQPKTYRVTASGQAGATVTFGADGAVLTSGATTLPIKPIPGTAAILVTEGLFSLDALLPAYVNSSHATAITLVALNGGGTSVRVDIAQATGRPPEGVPTGDAGLTLTTANSVTNLWYDPKTFVLHESRNATIDYGAKLTTQSATASTFAPIVQPTPVPLAAATYSSKDIAFSSADGIALAGTMTTPNTPAGRRPAVVLVHGSGAADRDETLGPNKIFLQLANALSNSGYVVVRYDKRGVGKSGGRPVNENRRELLLADTAAAVAFAAAQPEVDAHRIVVLGHSEGAELAPSLAITDPAVHAIVLLGAPALPLDQILVQQLTRDATGADYERLRTAARKRNAEIGASTLPSDAWMQSSFIVDPATEIARVPCPILILQGGKDIQVLAKDLPRLVDAARSTKRDLTVRVLPLDNHLFIPIAGDTPSSGAEYFIPGQVDPEAIDAITAWLATHV